MSVAAHLGISLAEYDSRIRTFIPDYEEMLESAAGPLGPSTRAIVDLGIGTGALSAACLQVATNATVVGIDEDAEVLKAAAARLGSRASFIRGCFESAEIPACDAVVASFALHHVRTEAQKAQLYRKLRSALRDGGVLITVDCQPAAEKSIACRQFAGWKRHLMLSYTDEEADGYLAAWAAEDYYVPLASEVAMMQGAGFKVEVLWRKGAFAVVHGTAV